MSTLTLVRHGQARPFERESDRLSELGRRQSCGLADWWIQSGVLFDEVYTGALVRQRGTAALVGERFAARRLPWPDPVVLPGLDEYDAPGIIRLARGDPELRALVETAGAASDTDRNRYFQRMLEAAMARWIAGALGGSGVEPWPQFRDRVRDALSRITADATPGRRVVAFTSGGPIGVAVQTALAAPDQSAIEVNWRVRNCSLTRFLFSRGKFTLDCFNAVPHLDDGLLSFR